jgi:hypothetical protein
MRRTARWENFFWVAVAACVLLGFAVWHNQLVEVVGRIALRSWGGEVSVPQPAVAMAYPRTVIVTALRKRLAALPADRVRAEERHAEAMRLWREKSTARDEALRVVQVAERANAEDLALCRERYDKAEVAAKEAFDDLERRAADLEKLADPAGLLVDLPGAVDTVEVGPDGGFTLAARVGQAPMVLVLAGETGGGQAWLRPIGTRSAGRIEMDFTNENLLTMDGLQELVGLTRAR